MDRIGRKCSEGRLRLSNRRPLLLSQRFHCRHRLYKCNTMSEEHTQVRRGRHAFRSLPCSTPDNCCGMSYRSKRNRYSHGTHSIFQGSRATHPFTNHPKNVQNHSNISTVVSRISQTASNELMRWHLLGRCAAVVPNPDSVRRTVLDPERFSPVLAK